MKRPTYLNCVLTVIALLLTAAVWTAIAERPLFATQAAASPMSPDIPDAGLQRKAIETAIKDMQRDVQQINTTLSGGRMKVEVTNLKDLEMNKSD